MLKDNSGITIITLTVMVIVLIILSSIFVATGLRSLSETQESKIKNEIHELSEAVATRYVSYVKNDKNILLIGASPSMSSGEFISFIREKNLEEPEKIDMLANKLTGQYYDEFIRVIGPNDARTLGVEPVSEDNIYIVDYCTAMVYGPIKQD